LSKPVITGEAGIFRVTWSDEHISMQIDRLRDRSDGSLTAEVVVKTTLPGIAPHLHRTRMNLLSTTGKSGLAKRLDEQAKGLDWSTMVEQACEQVIECFRQGDPVIRLGELSIREGLSYRVKPLLVENQANMIYGAGETGKSMMALYLAVLIDSPLDDCGLYAEPGNVLVLDYEADEHEVGYRIKCLQAGLELETSTDILYRFGRMPLADDIERIQEIVLEHSINVVIVDSFGMATGGDQDKSTDPIRYFQALRSLRCTSLTIDHQNKEGKQYGNIYKFNEARNIWEAKAVKETASSRMSVGLYHRKMNNGRYEMPMGFSLEFEEGCFRVSTQDLRSVGELEASLPLRFRIRDTLAHGAMSAQAITDELNPYPESPNVKRLSVETVRMTLNRNKELFTPVYQDGAREHLWGLKLSVSK